MMNGAKILSGGVLLSLVAIAHRHLTASVPAEGSRVQTPEHIVLSLSEAARRFSTTVVAAAGLPDRSS
jgi:methionine-rich copper-binding protein CopC